MVVDVVIVFFVGVVVNAVGSVEIVVLVFVVVVVIIVAPRNLNRK